MWTTIPLTSYQAKLDQAQQEKQRLQASSQELQAKFAAISAKKQQFKLEYVKCPSCQKYAFIETGVIMIDGQAEIFYGKYDYCEIEISQEEKEKMYKIHTTLKEYEIM